MEEEEMEMPTLCKVCGDWFDLNDGGPSADYKYQICKDCSEKELDPNHWD